MSQPKSDEELIEKIRSIIVHYGADEKEILEVTDCVRNALAQKDAELQKARERVYEKCGLDDPECWHGVMAKECKVDQCEKRALLKAYQSELGQPNKKI